MIITALNFLAIVITCLAVGYLLGYHVRSAMEQQSQPRADERKKKSYELKAERYFDNRVIIKADKDHKEEPLDIITPENVNSIRFVSVNNKKMFYIGDKFIGEIVE